MEQTCVSNPNIIANEFNDYFANISNNMVKILHHPNDISKYYMTWNPNQIAVDESDVAIN